MGSVQKMYGTVIGDSVASVDVPQDGHIVGVQFSVSMGMQADADRIAIQLAFASTSSLTVNDTRNVIAEVRMANELVTSGGMLMGINVFYALPDIPVGAGERLYLHAAGTSTGVAAQMACMIYYDFEEGRAPMRRR